MAEVWTRNLNIRPNGLKCIERPLEPVIARSSASSAAESGGDAVINISRRRSAALQLADRRPERQKTNEKNVHTLSFCLSRSFAAYLLPLRLHIINLMRSNFDAPALFVTSALPAALGRLKRDREAAAAGERVDREVEGATRRASNKEASVALKPIINERINKSAANGGRTDEKMCLSNSMAEREATLTPATINSGREYQLLLNAGESL